ncbi:MAG TPA: type 1 glutamine amidotransferase domain-containing protein, partial [candidate division Zixibacteria bacterium]|nr:type 1 glutamine amidotransferase domain-containing protein [candidate division Zixibacteria bacterium]
YFVLTEAGYEIDFVSPKGGKAPMDEKSRDLTDAQCREFVETPALIGNLDNTMSPSQVQPRNYDIIFFAGGHGTMWDFPENEELAKIAATVYERGGIIAAVCHGPAALLNIKLSNDKYLLKGKTVTSYTNEEESISESSEVVPFALETALIKRGAKFTETIEFKPHVVVSERLITGQNPASAAEVARAILRLTEKLEDPELQVSK